MTVSKLNGPCRNPWDLARTPGGSSGSVAAAVAGVVRHRARHRRCGFGAGTGGVVRPRRAEAVPGPRRVRPRGGPRLLRDVGPRVLSRSVRDAVPALMCWPPGAVDAGTRSPVRGRDTGGRERLRIGVCTIPPMGVVDPDCAAAADDVARLLEQLGHHVEPSTPAWDVILDRGVRPHGSARCRRTCVRGRLRSASSRGTGRW